LKNTNSMACNCLGVLILVCSLFTQAYPQNLITPENIIYEGSFRLDAGARVGSYGLFAYGGYAFAYNPQGDPSGANDGYPGSLFGSGHETGNCIAEVSIPQPVISSAKNVSDLPSTTPLQAFADPFTGLPSIANIGVWGLAYLPAQDGQGSGKLYADLGDDYNALTNAVHMAWMDPDLSNPNTAGLWRLGSYAQWDIGRYLFEIPKVWADSNTPGKILACGRCRNWGAEGPNLFACAPWENGNPPPSGDTIEGIPLMHFTGKADKAFTACTDYCAGAWLTMGNRSAVVILATVNYSLDHLYYHGHYGPGRYPCFLFYDPDDLSGVAKGQKDSWEPRWYARKNLDHFFFGETGPSGGNFDLEAGGYSPGGMAYDRERGRLYVAQRLMPGGGGNPVIHVFRIDTTESSVAMSAAKADEGITITIRPNPFNPSTVINIKEQVTSSKKQAGKTEVKIFNVHGKLIQLLTADYLLLASGLTWDASSFPSGIYIARVRIGGMTATKTMTLLK